MAMPRHHRLRTSHRRLRPSRVRLACSIRFGAMSMPVTSLLFSPRESRGCPCRLRHRELSSPASDQAARQIRPHLRSIIFAICPKSPAIHIPRSLPFKCFHFGSHLCALHMITSRICFNRVSDHSTLAVAIVRGFHFKDIPAASAAAEPFVRRYRCGSADQSDRGRKPTA